MVKLMTAGLTALVVTVSPPAHAQTPSYAAFSTADANSVTDARINAVKSALQLTPEQQKYWPAIEDAVRASAKDRQARIASVAERLDEIRNRSTVEALQKMNPVDLMQRRAAALSQRAANLTKVADAWKPLYQILTPDQKLRMAFLTISTLHDFRVAVEQQPGTQFEVDYGETIW